MTAGLVQFAGSLVAVSLLIWLAFRLGFSGRPSLNDEHDVRRLANEVTGGCIPVAILLACDRSAALVRDATGRIVLVSPKGAHFVATPLSRRTHVERTATGFRIREGALTGEFEMGGATEDWERALARLE